MEYNSGSPIYLQVINELKKKMVKGELKPGEKMPSNRELAVLYKVNQNTAARIYREMEMAGYCYTKRGIGTFVSEEEYMFDNVKKEMAEELLKNFVHEMRDLGFQKGEIIEQIADYEEEQKFGNKEAVKELTLKLKKGTIYGLLGENGSGKTTLMKMAAGLTQPTEGEILFEGHPLSYQDKASIAYMSTEPFFYSYMKVKDVEEYYADFFEDFDREQFRKTIERLGLNEEMKASAMSSGMNAKLKAAATLARKADLLLLDEPLNGVDYKAREEIIALILEEADENRTMVISTHLIEEVESFIEDAIFIKDGQLVDVVNVETERMTTGNSLAELYLQKM